MSEELELIAGTVNGITQKKSDTWTIQVTPEGSKYAKNLWTKDAELVAATSQKIGENGAFVGSLGAPYTVDGKEVRSWWIKDGSDTPVEAPKPTPEAAVALAHVSRTPEAQNASEPVDWDAKERRDYRSRAWAQTLGAFQHTIKVDEDPVAVFLRLQPFQRKIYEDVTQGFAWDDSDIPFD